MRCCRSASLDERFAKKSVNRIDLRICGWVAHCGLRWVYGLGLWRGLPFHKSKESKVIRFMSRASETANCKKSRLRHIRAAEEYERRTATTIRKTQVLRIVVAFLRKHCYTKLGRRRLSQFAKFEQFSPIAVAVLRYAAFLGFESLSFEPLSVSV